MSTFINNDITTAGLIVLAKGQSGQIIRYSRIVLGDGYLGEAQSPRNLSEVIHPVVSLDITKCMVNEDGTVAVGAIFTNRELETGFYYRELALYAEDPDPNVGEVLYCYGNAGDLAEWIPATGGATIVEKTVDIVTVIGTASNVTAIIPPDAYATKQDYLDAIAVARAAQEFAQSSNDKADAAMVASGKALDSVTALSNQVGDNTSKIKTLWDAVFSEITSNPFQITFGDLAGITLTSGIWNKTLQRLEC